MIESVNLPPGDYVAPELSRIQPDSCFPHMTVGNPRTHPWEHLRHDIPHNWYIDGRYPGIGFINRDEAHILYNTALQFAGKHVLEIGCWLGWSACHLAIANVQLDVIDPILAKPEILGSVRKSLALAGVLHSVNLVAGSSPDAVDELGRSRQWSLMFIDGEHFAPGPLNDAIVCERYAAKDAAILFHDLASPDVAEGLAYLGDRGWNVRIYHTMQIMGVAWRGNVRPVDHSPDPTVQWDVPDHLQRFVAQSPVSVRS